MTDFAAIDLGAESGRVVLGRLADDRVELDVIHRFQNRPVLLPDGLHWNFLALFSEAVGGLGLAARRGDLAGVGVDSWGVDYALLDARGRVLGLPFHYRDTRTEGMVAHAHTRVSRDELYATTGIQTMPINTIFQLLADDGTPALAAAERIALVPDLFALWLTGELTNESTIASTTGLLDAASGRWARSIIDRLGLPAAPFSGDPVEPGTTIGPVLGHHEGIAGTTVQTVAGHDTASAFAAAPLKSASSAILSSGTWSLLGLELDAPVLTPEAAAYNLTNERGVDGTIRLLRNVMGLWLLQECRRQWEPCDYDELQQLARDAPAGVPLFDPDRDEFLTPGDMPARIAAACRATGQEPPATRGEFTRSILTSLACKYRFVLDALRRVSGREPECVHVVGGGAQNDLLCRLTADVTGLPVHAGPVEATAIGNILVQARAVGELASLTDIRAVAAASASPVTYEPGDAGDLYDRFLAVTGLAKMKETVTS